MRQVHVVVAQRRQGVCIKSDGRTGLLFCQSKPFVVCFFFAVLVPSSSSLLELPIVSQGQLEDKANCATFIMRYLFYWTSVFQAHAANVHGMTSLDHK